jgi:hypothetical protein
MPLPRPPSPGRTVAEKKPFLLRIPPDLWEEIQRWAADDLRSVNGQIEYLLRRAVEERRKGRSKSGAGGTVSKGESR